MALQDTVVSSPCTTRSGKALIETVGVKTLTVAVEGAEVPPGPEHVIEYDDVEAGLTWTPLEFEGVFPVENPPAEVQEVAFVELQVNRVDWPLSIGFGLAVKETVGTHAWVLHL